MTPSIIDSHTHLVCDHPEALGLLEDLNLKVMGVSIAQDSEGKWRKAAREGPQAYRTLAQTNPHRSAWCTSFDLPRFSDPHYAEKVIADLDEDFRDGAVACKIWKNIGMQVKDAGGAYVMVDHPILRPIFEHLEKEGRTLLMHTGEPKACWEPLSSSSPHAPYYKKNPQWHFHGKENLPSYEQVLLARDHVLELHSKLRVVGAHLASLEWNVAEVAKRLDKYPNFAVDTAARVKDLVTHDRDTLRDFFGKYQDRILFGTDRVISSFSKQEDEERKKAVQGLRAWYEGQIAYYSEDRQVAGLERSEKESRGLALPTDTLRKFFSENAKVWYPGI